MFEQLAQLRSETEVVQWAEATASALLNEYYAIDLVVFAKKMEVISGVLRQAGLQRAYLDASASRDGVECQGAVIKATRPQPIWIYPDYIVQAESDFKVNQSADKARLDAMKKQAQSNGEARSEEQKDGNIMITLRKV